MAEFKIYKSLIKPSRLLAITSPFLMIGLYGLNARVSPISARNSWICIAIFGLAVLFFLYRLLDRRPQFLFTEAGIFNRSVHPELIEWSAIYKVYIKDINNTKCVCLVIKNENPEIIPDKIIDGKPGYQVINFPMDSIYVDERRFMDFIIEMSKTDVANRVASLKKITPGSFR